MMLADTPIRLDRLDHIPTSLIGSEPEAILDSLPHPSVITLAGDRGPPLWLSLLLHGNETSSFHVLRMLAERYRDRPPPRDLSIFVGNVRATAAGKRFLPGQPDFNRIWSDGESPYHALVREVTEIAREQNPFASVDIHNNSGRNPHYGCVNALRPADLHLAAMFDQLGVYYRTPSSTQSIAFSAFCPAVTIECGKTGDHDGHMHALDFIDRVLDLDRFPDTAPTKDALKLYHTVGSMIVDPDASIAFAPDEADVVLDEGLEALNFVDLQAGAYLARAGSPRSPIAVIDEQGHDLTDLFFDVDDGRISLKRPATPAMITRDLDIVKQDCLGYLMERL